MWLLRDWEMGMVARGIMMPSALRRVCPCGELLTGVQIAAVVDLASSLRSTRIEVPIWTWMQTLSTVLLIKVVQHDRPY